MRMKSACTGIAFLVALAATAQNVSCSGSPATEVSPDAGLAPRKNGFGIISPQGGTITGVTAGSGLSGGGTGGSLTMRVLTATGGGLAANGSGVSLDSTGCGSGQVPTWSGTAWACTTPAGGSSLSGLTATYIPTATGSNAIANSDLFDDGSSVIGTVNRKVQIGPQTVPAQNQMFFSRQSTATTTQVWIQEDDTGHVGTGGNNEVVNLVLRDNAGFALGSGGTATAGALDIAVQPTVTSGSGALSVKAIVSAATGCVGGGSCEAFEATHGTIKVFDDGNSLGSTTFSNELTSTGKLTVTGGGLVTLGQNVGSFQVTANGLSSAAIVGIGNYNTGAPLSIKNTTNGPSGMTIHADTSLNANDSGQIVFNRGAGNGAEKGGLVLVGNAGSYASGALVNDMLIYDYDATNAGQGIDFATGTGPTVRVRIANTGDVDFTSHQLHSVADPSSAQDAATKNYVDTHSGSGSVTGTGTSGRSARWSGTTALGNGAWTDDGTNATANGVTTVQQLIGTVITPTLASGTTNDWAPTGMSTAETIVVAPSGGLATITGITGCTVGRTIKIYNASATDHVTFAPENASSSASNRIVSPWGVTDQIYLFAGVDAWVQMECIVVSTNTRWRITAVSAKAMPSLSIGFGTATINNSGDINAHTVSTNSYGDFAAGVYAGPSDSVIMHNGYISFAYGTAGTATGYINSVGYQESTAQFRNLEIDDGKGSGSTHYVASFDGSTRLLDLAIGSIYLGRQTFTSSGTYTPTTGTRKVLLKVCGAGGGGGGAKSAGAGGGASGAWLEKWINPSATITGGTVTIGTAGTAGAATPTIGGTGGDTSAVIQTVTYTAKGGLGGAVGGSQFTAGGNTVSGSTAGDVNSQGQAGQTGVAVSGGLSGVGGPGGSSPYGGGGGPTPYSSTDVAGQAANGRCAGGGGGGSQGAGAAGGVGTGGLVIVEEYR